MGTRTLPPVDPKVRFSPWLGKTLELRRRDLASKRCRQGQVGVGSQRHRPQVFASKSSVGARAGGASSGRVRRAASSAAGQVGASDKLRLRMVGQKEDSQTQSNGRVPSRVSRAFQSVLRIAEEVLKEDTAPPTTWRDWQAPVDLAQDQRLEHGPKKEGPLFSTMCC